MEHRASIVQPLRNEYQPTFCNLSLSTKRRLLLCLDVASATLFLVTYIYSPSDEEFVDCKVNMKDRVLVFLLYWYLPVFIFSGISV